MKNIEVEISTFVTLAEWQRLRRFFRKHAKFVGAHRDRTTYFDRNGRLRTRVEPQRAYLVFKAGHMHDPHREEIEIAFSKRDVPMMERLLSRVGFSIASRWFRRREKYLWKDFTVTLDDTKGYGKVFEIEKMASRREKSKALRAILNQYRFLGIKPLPAKVMDRHYHYYLRNWKRLISA